MKKEEAKAIVLETYQKKSRLGALFTLGIFCTQVTSKAGKAVDNWQVFSIETKYIKRPAVDRGRYANRFVEMIAAYTKVPDGQDLTNPDNSEWFEIIERPTVAPVAPVATSTDAPPASTEPAPASKSKKE